MAIVDAYDDPQRASPTWRPSADLRPRRRAPRPADASSKVNQSGAARRRCRAGDYGWAEEISLDLDAVSSACPDCHILLVEANSANTPDLLAAEDTAARLGAASISNS